MRIGLKLTAAFMAIASLVGVAGYLAHATTRQVEEHMDRLSRSAILKASDAAQMAVALHAGQLVAHRHLHVLRGVDEPASHATLDSWRRQLASQERLVEESLDRQRQVAESMIRWAEVRGLGSLVERERKETLGTLDRLREAFYHHLEIQEEFVTLAGRDPDQADRVFAGPLSDHFERELLPLLATYRRRAEDELTELVRATERAIAVADQRRSWLIVAAAMGAVVLGLATSRAIGRSMTRLQSAAEQIGQGRFEVRVPVRAHDEIGLLAHSINQMAANLQETTVSRRTLDNIIQSMREMLIVVDPGLRITHVNQAACVELHYSSGSLPGRPIAELFAAGQFTSDRQWLDLLAAGMECRMLTQERRPIPVHCSAAAMHDSDGRLEGYVCVASNITRQKEAEGQLLASLREKELLLKEVHHRVKNNLQVVSSLLNLQARELPDPQVARLFQDSQGRIRSMALLHEQLYRSHDLARIDFAAYVRDLVRHLESGLGDDSAPVTFHLDIESVPLSLDLAIPCGMIVNELVSNAQKHAFRGRQGGEIRIVFARRDDGYCLSVADNGVGMEQADRLADSPSLGLQVVHALTRQLHGSLAVHQDRGTNFEVRFHSEHKELH